MCNQLHKMSTGRLIILSFLVFSALNTVYSASNLNRDNTEIAREPDDRPLLFTTLGGGMVALDQVSGNIIWTLKDEPVVKVPNENDHYVPQFLPDPRHGSLYMFGSHAGERQVLKKLPFTIPQLVANAPCRSSDGILYTGKKSDTWFMIDPKTGIRKHILGVDKADIFESSKSNTCPIDPKNAIYVARTEYNVLMYDSKNDNKRWNVTFFDYSSHTMGQDMSKSYGTVHFTSTSSGRVTSFDRKTGNMIWSRDMQSPIVAAYLLDRDGLISVPFNAVGDDTMDHIMEDVSTLTAGQGFKHSNIELFPSLYVGEHIHGLYALSSLVDKNTITISTEGSKPLLLEGPTEKNNNVNKDKYRYPTFRKKINVHYNIKNTDDPESVQAYLLLGHYSIPEYANTNLGIISKALSLPGNMIEGDSVKQDQVKLIIRPNDDTKEQNWYEIENTTIAVLNPRDKEFAISSSETDNEEDLNETKSLSQSVGVQTDYDSRDADATLRWSFVYKYAYQWITHQDNKGLKLALILLMCVVVAMFWYLRNQIKEFQQQSQSGSRNSNTSSFNGKITAISEELENGSVKVGKIVFHPEQILGKGCEGTFVYRGTFENRDVAVKRLLPECFTFADREVALLTESDAHANVVRYFCMEQDKLFRYIALELCAATLQEYVQKNLEVDYEISPLEVLQQATSGLAHLHSLDIVHRDIKPHNVLLSVPSKKSAVRAMISDFGLCKKLNIGRNSFSRRSGVTGTDGWIAPEMLKGERTTTSVDIFSLGCVFYYVLSKGTHPFGDVLERQGKILKGRYNLNGLIISMPEEEVELTVCLLKTMLNSRPFERPTAIVVYKYPLFWNKQRILTFLQDISDRVEKDPPGGPLELGALAVVRGDWRACVGNAVAADLRKYRSYSGDSVRDLLRAMRNKKHHYRELTLEAQTSLGIIPDGFTLYWLSRFPRLLLHAWLQMQTLKEESIFKSYYDPTYIFDNHYILKEVEFNNIKIFNAEKPIEGNNLFIKSKNYYDNNSPQKMKYKNDNSKFNRPNAVEDWRATPRTDFKNPDEAANSKLYVNDRSDFSRRSPVRSPENRDMNRFNEDGNREVKMSPNRNKKTNAYRNKSNAQQMDSGINNQSEEPVNKVKNKRKKEETPLVWTLPNQSPAKDWNADS